MSRIKKFLITMHKPLLLSVNVNGVVSESAEFLQVLVKAINFARAGRGTADILLRKPGVHEDTDVQNAIEVFVESILVSISAGESHDDEIITCTVNPVEIGDDHESCLPDVVQVAITCKR